MANMSDEEFVDQLRSYSYIEKLTKGGVIVNDLAVSEFFSYTYEPEDLFESCSFVMRKNYTISSKACNEIFNITVYFKEAFKCYSFNYLTQREYSYSSMQRIKGD